MTSVPWLVGVGVLESLQTFGGENLIVLKSQLPRQDGRRHSELSSGGQGVHALPEGM